MYVCNGVCLFYVIIVALFPLMSLLSVLCVSFAYVVKIRLEIVLV